MLMHCVYNRNLKEMMQIVCTEIIYLVVQTLQSCSHNLVLEPEPRNSVVSQKNNSHKDLRNTMNLSSTLKLSHKPSDSSN